MKITHKFCIDNNFEKVEYDERNPDEGYYFEKVLAKLDNDDDILSIVFDTENNKCYLYPFNHLVFTTQEQVINFINSMPQ